MRSHIKRLVIPLCVLLTLLVTGSVFGAGETGSNIALPAGVVMVEGFEPGLGFPVGRVLLVENEVVLIHEAGAKGYPAQRNHPLYKRDTVITGSDGRTRFHLKDESVMTLAPNTRLEINESVYDGKKKSRFSFLNMPLGKTRFLVRKMKDFRRSEFKVKTPTALVGVRGSDFIILAMLDRTEVVALKDTVLEVVSLSYPDRAPMIVKSYQKTLVEEGKLPTVPEDISVEEAEKLVQEFLFAADAVVAALKVEPAKAKEIAAKVAEKVKPIPEEVVERVRWLFPELTAIAPEEELVAAAEGKVRLLFPERPVIVQGEELVASVEEKVQWRFPEFLVIVPEEDLVYPDLITDDKEMKKLLDSELEKIGRPSPLFAIGKPDLIEIIDLIDMMDEFGDFEDYEDYDEFEDRLDTEIIEIITDIVSELPGFPGTPTP